MKSSPGSSEFPCPICNELGVFALRVGEYEIVECGSCVHRYLDSCLTTSHIEQHYGDSYFDGGGAGYVDYLSQEKLITSYGRNYASMLGRHCSVGSVLDVGSAAGFFMKGLHDNGWEVTGVEPNGKMVSEANQRFDFHSIHGSLEDLDIREGFNLVTMVQVIAHFRNLRVAFDKAMKAIMPGGFLLVETWNFRSLPARILGAAWHEYSPPTAVNWFSPKSLNELASQFGLQKVAGGHPKKRITGRHAASLLAHSAAKIGRFRNSTPNLSAVPESLVFPYPAFDVFWTLFKLPTTETRWSNPTAQHSNPTGAGPASR